MGILSDSINLLSKSLSKISSLSSNLRDLKSHHHHHHHHNHHKLEKKLLVARERTGKVYYSRLSTDQNLYYEDLCFPDTMRTRFFYPCASSHALLFAHFSDSSALWNPTTDEAKALPTSSVSLNRSAAIKSWGFGFDHGSKDYKVIRLLDYGQVELYSLKSDSWKEITCRSQLAASGTVNIPSIHINGFSYWVTPNFIFYFDFASEEFSTAPHIPLPKTDKLKDPFILVEFDGSLAILVYPYQPFRNNNPHFDNKTFEFEIWVWKDESWTRVVFQIIDQLINNDFIKPVGIFNNDKFYFQNSVDDVMIFDCGKRELQNLGLGAGRVDIFPYVESQERIKQV